MTRDAKFRSGRWLLAGAIALAGGWTGAAVAQVAPGADAPAFARDQGHPVKTPTLTPAERAHIRQIRKDGKEAGLTKAQIRAEIQAYLRSLGRTRTKRPTIGEIRSTP